MIKKLLLLTCLFFAGCTQYIHQYRVGDIVKIKGFNEPVKIYYLSPYQKHVWVRDKFGGKHAIFENELEPYKNEETSNR